MSKQRFSKTLFRFSKNLSFRHLKNISARCLAVIARELLLHILQMSFGTLGMRKIFSKVINVCHGKRGTVFHDFDLDCVTGNVKTEDFT